MGGLFSTLSKQLLGNFLLSSGLPALAFVLGFQALVAPHLPETWHILEAPEALEAEWKTAIAAIAVVIVATALAALNGPIIRLFEGYPFVGSWIGYKMTERHRKKAREAETWWRGVRSVLRGVDRLDPRGAKRAKEMGARDLGKRWNRVGWTIPRLYPEPSRVLPTRLGNLIRAFEDYPFNRYGIYGVTTWPRLASVIDESYAKRIGDAKQPFDLMINGSFVSLSLAFFTLMTGFLWPGQRGHSWPDWLIWAIAVIALSLVGWLCYVLALPRAEEWGDMVKSAYDLYRWDLLEKLHHPAPEDPEAERDLWQRVGGHMLFARMSTTPAPGYAKAEKATSEPGGWLGLGRRLFQSVTTAKGE